MLADRQGLWVSGLSGTCGKGSSRGRKLNLARLASAWVDPRLLRGWGPKRGGITVRRRATGRPKIAGEQYDPLPQQCDRVAPPAPRGCRFFERAAKGQVIPGVSGPSVPSTRPDVVVAASYDIEVGILRTRVLAEAALGPLYHHSRIEFAEVGFGLRMGRSLEPCFRRFRTRFGGTVVGSPRGHHGTKGFFVLFERNQPPIEGGELLLEGCALGFDFLETLLDCMKLFLWWSMRSMTLLSFCRLEAVGARRRSSVRRAMAGFKSTCGTSALARSVSRCVSKTPSSCEALGCGLSGLAQGARVGGEPDFPGDD